MSATVFIPLRFIMRDEVDDEWARKEEKKLENSFRRVCLCNWRYAGSNKEIALAANNIETFLFALAKHAMSDLRARTVVHRKPKDGKFGGDTSRTSARSETRVRKLHKKKSMLANCVPEKPPPQVKVYRFAEFMCPRLHQTVDRKRLKRSGVVGAQRKRKEKNEPHQLSLVCIFDYFSFFSISSWIIKHVKT